MSSDHDTIQKQFNEFIASNPKATYEEWISAIHPESQEKCLLDDVGSNNVGIDPEYYSHDNEFRKVWNENTQDKRTKVPSSPTSVCKESHIPDLLGDGKMMHFSLDAANETSERMSPDQDLLSFD
eukprot:Nitzschia sp. Nitz4//scaffold168_size48592//27754//28128//NITZ4_007052-RA/size48592-processed-gene-0.28-mRNA-1//1//CDS//3329538327//127//frame0